jgi:DnaJ-class molecular chaperone
MSEKLTEALTADASGPVCEVCSGTGRIVVMRSAFKADGYASKRCGICSGTGVSAYRDPAYARSQRQLRAALSAASPTKGGDA